MYEFIFSKCMIDEQHLLEQRIFSAITTKTGSKQRLNKYLKACMPISFDESNYHISLFSTNILLMVTRSNSVLTLFYLDYQILIVVTFVVLLNIRYII